MKSIRALAVALGVTVALVAAPAAIAQAGTGHHHKHGHQSAQQQSGQHKADRHRSHHKAQHGQAGKHSCSVAPKCRPHPLTKPQGGWPCAETGTCASKHHHPICKPGTPHQHHSGHKPGKPSHPNKPGKPSTPSTPDKPSTPVGLTNAHTATADSPVPNVDRLAFTGAFGVPQYTAAGLVAILLSVGLLIFGTRRPRQEH